MKLYPSDLAGDLIGDMVTFPWIYLMILLLTLIPNPSYINADLNNNYKMQMNRTV
jgi:hypothetical protein